MDAYDYVHLALHAVGGEIKGKTKLQKTMYFLGLLSEHSNELGYRPHFYGPYSEEVADAMDRLKTLQFVDQDVRGGGAVNEQGFEVCRYDYRLNDDGKKVAAAKARKHPDEWKALSGAAQRLKQAEDLDYMKLSIAAKTHFLLTQKQGEATEQELANLASKFGWQVSGQEVKEAAAYLQKLKLVTLA